MASIVEPPLPQARFTYGGDEFIFCEIDEAMSFGANFKALAVCQELARRKVDGVVEICPANASFLVRLNPDVVRPDALMAQLKEIERLEHNLATLATVGSISPYVGLFGTVWGIMSAFTSLSNVQQATLASVAPGIAEALVATAIGLFAAIPAVIGYNRYADQLSKLEMRYDAFMEEFSTILQRHATRAPGS